MTGTPGARFATDIKKMLEDSGVHGSVVKAEGDLFELHKWVKDNPVDLLIGTTHCKYIARAEDIPLVRVGFPILTGRYTRLCPSSATAGACA